jgi:phospholipase A1/A2
VIRRRVVVLLAAILAGVAGGAAASALEDRLATEQQWVADGLFILPHRPNYFMPLSYNPRPNNAVLPPGSPSLQDIETKFQLSVKIPLADHLFQYPVQPVVAYTQVSYWQTYNRSNSSLFRDTDYEPEFFLQAPSAVQLGWFTNRFCRLGYAHQSNGQAAPQSRSWNRMYAEFVMDHDHSMISIKPWFRIPGPAEEDTNPGMAKYYGYGEIRGATKFLGRNEVSLLFRNNFRVPDNKGAIEIGWSFPLIRRLNGFIQYFNGYGESLLDYNYPVSRISVGFAVSNWL